jgi:hypothetical protein
MNRWATAIISVFVFLFVVATVQGAYDKGYSDAHHRTVVDYNDGFIDGENTNVAR